MTEPTIVELPDRAYVSLPGTVTMRTIAEIADRLPEVFGWLGARGIEPAGAPFFRYNVIDMVADLELEVGVPVEVPVEVSGELIAGTLPGGRYVTVTHHGHPDGLHDATAALLDWAAERGLVWDRSGNSWGCRLEVYLTDPAIQPDMSKWETELQFRLTDQ
jgi:effector-binding domain-containing protein